MSEWKDVTAMKQAISIAQNSCEALLLDPNSYYFIINMSAIIQLHFKISTI